MRDSSDLVMKKVGWNCISVHFGSVQGMSHKRQVMGKQRASLYEPVQKHFVIPASISL